MPNETSLQTRGAATAPSRLSSKDWWLVAKRVFNRLDEDNVTMLCAGIAFYSMLAIFPALAAVVTLYAMIADPADLESHLLTVSSLLPADVTAIFDDQLSNIMNGREDVLSFRLFVGFGFALWSAHRGVHALVTAITIAYREQETRHFVRLNLFSFLLTVAAVFMVVVAMIVTLIVPIALKYLPVLHWQALLTTLLTWTVFFTLVISSFSLLYRVSPPRRPAKWRWLSPGAVIATLLWLTSSYLFSTYVSEFGNYNEIYGTLGAIIVLLLWFFLTSLSIVMGALVNAEMEVQTLADSTIGKDRPIGQRGAVVADTQPP